MRSHQDVHDTLFRPLPTGGSKGKGRRLKHGPPECYSPPVDESTPTGVVWTFQRVVFAWREGRHVVVVRGDGFNLG